MISFRTSICNVSIKSTVSYQKGNIYKKKKINGLLSLKVVAAKKGTEAKNIQFPEVNNVYKIIYEFVLTFSVPLDKSWFPSLSET